MRTIPDRVSRLFEQKSFWVDVDVKVYSDSAWYSIGQPKLGGWNWVRSVELRQDVDSVAGTATIQIYRECGSPDLSMNPINQTSPLNLAPPYDTSSPSYTSLLYPARSIRVYASYSAAGRAIEDSSHWMMIFSGKIDSVDWGSPTITVQCRDVMCRLQDRFIEKVLLYGFTETTSGNVRGCMLWEPQIVGSAVSSPDTQTRVVPSWADNETWSGHLHYFKCTTTVEEGVGASGDTSEPDFASATPEAPDIEDNQITWTRQSTEIPRNQTTLAHRVMEGIIADNMDGETGLLLHPSDSGGTDPDWEVSVYRQDRMSVADAVRNLALQMGWTITARHATPGDPSTEDYYPTLWEPDRDASSTLHTFDGSSILDWRKASVSVDGIRNAVAVVYQDWGATQLDGKAHPPKTFTATDSTSISAYGRRFCEVAVGSTSQIDSSLEAQDLANAVLADLKDPYVECEITVPLFLFAELGDLYSFTDDFHAPTAQSLAVVGVSHSIGQGSATSTLSVRGKPSCGQETWLRRLAGNGSAPPFHNTRPPTPIASEFKRDIAYGAKNLDSNLYVNVITIKYTAYSYRWKTLKLFASETDDFTIGSANFHSESSSGVFHVNFSHLTGTYYLYGRFVGVDENGVHSLPSDQFQIYPELV